MTSPLPFPPTSAVLSWPIGRLSTCQLERKRKRKEKEWNHIFKEYTEGKSISNIIKHHPDHSERSVYRRIKRWKGGDKCSDKEGRGKKRRIFNDEEENILAGIIRGLQKEKNIVANRDIVRRESINLFRSKYPNVRIHDRSFSDGFISGLKARHGFSDRQIYVNRTLAKITQMRRDEDEIDYYVLVEEAIQRYGKDLVMNFDETPCKICDIPLRGWGEKGNKEKTTINSTKSEKDTFSLLPCITASGKTLPFGWIKRKVTTSATIDAMKLPKSMKSFYSWSGWTNSSLMIHYINQVILPYTKGRPCALTLDEYESHNKEEFINHCFDHNIELIKVPKGKTDKLQPLDISFNAEFKRIREKIAMETKLLNTSMFEELKFVVMRAEMAYYQVNKETILKGWEAIKVTV